MRSVVAKAYDGVVKEGKMVLFRSYKKEYATENKSGILSMLKMRSMLFCSFWTIPG